MRQQEEQINRVESQRRELEVARKELEDALGLPRRRKVSAFLNVNQGRITVEYMGAVVEAAPRPIIVADELAYEYTFKVGSSGEQTDVWQFYLVPEGEGRYALNQRPDGGASSRLCDHENDYVSAHIVREVCVSLLRSAYFDARPIVTPGRGSESTSR